MVKKLSPDVTAVNLFPLHCRDLSESTGDDACPKSYGSVFKLVVDPVPSSYGPYHSKDEGATVTTSFYGASPCGGVEECTCMKSSKDGYTDIATGSFVNSPHLIGTFARTSASKKRKKFDDASPTNVVEYPAKGKC